MTAKRELFQELDEYRKMVVRLGDNKQIQVERRVQLLLKLLKERSNFSLGTQAADRDTDDRQAASLIRSSSAWIRSATAISPPPPGVSDVPQSSLSSPFGDVRFAK